MTQQEWITRGYLIPGQTWPVELRWLYKNLASSKAHAEVGVYCGRSLWASVGAMRPGSVVYAIDDGSFRKDATLHPSGQWATAVYEATLEALNRDRRGVQVLPVHSDSVRAAQDLWRAGVKLDSVFIDGCHGYAEVLADIETFLPLIRPGGLICGHDMTPRFPGVEDAVHQSFDGHFEVAPQTRIWFKRLPA